MKTNYIFQTNKLPDLFFSTRYFKWIAKFRTLRETDRPGVKKVPITENILKTIWYEQRYDRRKLTTEAGKKVVIISPGEWNTADGPDFLHARIQVDGIELSGDVEVDVYTSGWEQHRHFQNQSYSNVILQVVYLNDLGKTKILRTVQGLPVGQIRLNARVYEDYLVDLGEEIPVGDVSIPSRCGKVFTRIRIDYLEHLLTQAGDARILHRVNLYRPLVNKSGFDNVFYTGLIEAAGYTVNRTLFRRVAELLPYGQTAPLTFPVPINKRDLFWQAIFYRVADLLPDTVEYHNLDIETRTYSSQLEQIYRAYTLKSGGISEKISNYLKRTEWRYKNCRPANYPERRFAGLSVLLANSVSPDGIFNFFYDKYKQILNINIPDQEKILRVSKLFIVEKYGYFAYRTRFNSRIMKKGYDFIGPGRALTIWVNVFLPLTLLRAEMENDVKVKELSYNLFVQVPPKEANRNAKLMLTRICGNKIQNQLPFFTERIQQGLLQIYADFCLAYNFDCRTCCLPELITSVSQVTYP